MSKDDIIDKLLIEYDIWECGYTRSQLEALTRKELLCWLRRLEGKNE